MFDQLVTEIVDADLHIPRRDSLVAQSGFKTYSHRE